MYPRACREGGRHALFAPFKLDRDIPQVVVFVRKKVPLSQHATRSDDRARVTSCRFIEQQRTMGTFEPSPPTDKRKSTPSIACLEHPLTASNEASSSQATEKEKINKQPRLYEGSKSTVEES